MNYKIVVFGVKDTSYDLIEYIQKEVLKVDLIVTIDSSILKSTKISGYSSLDDLQTKYQIEIFKSDDYSMQSVKCIKFFQSHTFELGISMGWQRLLPYSVLERFKFGVFGFHGSCGYLPYGRGRSPLNWSLINGDTRFILNLFQYDEKADSPNVYKKQMFEITIHDTIRTLQYKNLLCSKQMIKDLIEDYKKQLIRVNKNSRDFETWYSKRSFADGKLDFKRKTRELYNLIRGVSRPFPGAFAFCDVNKILIWKAIPFDQIIDFSNANPGEVIEVLEQNILVRTVDGSLLILEYESEVVLKKGNILA